MKYLKKGFWILYLKYKYKIKFIMIYYNEFNVG